ncbi:MAG: N-acyl homoserine lactonase family protein [Chloroflexi bacterium]|nr:MAG: N-acyl homoserine lactonase family protein [Chloroflexota bacterium]
MTPVYELFAIRYATREARRSANFLGGDPHDAPMPMDYYVWAARSADRCIVIDTGFTAETAARRKRNYLRSPIEGLAALGIGASDVHDVILTHLHYDHVGGFLFFPEARFHLQDDEMKYATGRHMCFDRFNHGYDVEDVVGMMRLVFRKRVAFYRGDAVVAPGISIHRIGGHTAGLQCVRVHTARGWVVVASDASHYYEHFETDRAFPTVFHVGELLDGYNILRQLADSPDHIVPGHDPLVMSYYPAVSESLRKIAVRLDSQPIGRDANATGRQPNAR